MKRHSLIFIAVWILSICLHANDVVSADEKDLYRLTVNDWIAIRVIDHPELMTEAIVGEDGTIAFPYIGTVHVKDLTLREIEKEITDRLSAGFVKYPVVSASLARTSVRKIYAYGEVNYRTDIPFEDDMTLEEALSLARGVTSNGLYGQVIVRRKHPKSKTYKDIVVADLDKGIIDNRSKAETILKPDDIIVVKYSDTFLIQGETQQKGRFILERNITVGRALLQAGGVTKEGLYGKVKVRRQEKGAEGSYKDIAESYINDGVIESREVEDMLIAADDIVAVERNDTFLIQGEVANRGRFVLEKSMTVLRALLQAGGVTKEGLYGKVKVRRQEKGEEGSYRDIAESYINDGVIESREVEDMLLAADDIVAVERSDTFLTQGEVANRGRFVLEKDMTLLKALLQAGGTSRDGMFGKIKVRRQGQEGQENYVDIAESRLNKGAIVNKEVENVILQPDDIVIVEQNDTFYIYGEVIKTGEFVLQNDMTVFKAITMAGGFTKWGSGSRVKVLRPNDDKKGYETIKVDIDDVLDGDAASDVALQPNDTIIVSASIL